MGLISPLRSRLTGHKFSTMADPSFCYPATTSFTLNMVHMQTPHLIWKLVKGKEGRFEDGLGDNVFACTKDDNRPGMSAEDRKFINIMNSSLARNESGSWEAALPVPEEFNVAKYNLG